MVEIIMATYNGEKYVEEQIKSIMDNSFKNIKLNIFDDGSTDNTISIIEELSKSDKRISISQNEKNIGPTLNFLTALKKSDAEYIMFCDQDDIWKKEKIKKTLEKIKQMENNYGKSTEIAVFTDNTVVDRNLNIIAESFFKSEHLDTKKLSLNYILMENKLIGCTVMINRALKERLTFLPKHAKVHDWWIALIASSFGKIGYFNEKTMLYRQHENNVIGGNKNFMSYVRNRVTSLNKQKESLIILQKQAEEFKNIYENELSEKNIKILNIFSNLNNMSILKRRYYIIKYHFYKTGFIRNIGVFLIV